MCRYFLYIGILLAMPFYNKAQTTTINYTVTDADFANPERGFYRYSDTYGNGYSSLDSATLANYRYAHQPPSANYSIYATLVFRYFGLDAFKTSAISSNFLQNVDQDFITARKAGVKLILRFTYTVVAPSGNCGSWICPPYGDAPKAIVLQHIAQLKPYFIKHSDVIAAVQMGFIGVWGENYYTDYFGDASIPPYSLNATNWSDRKEVLDSLLAAVPQDINVQVRYPQMKQKDIYGNSAGVTSPALMLSEAFSGSNKSRIGFHNDCFLANFDDYGTYANYDNGSSDTLHLKPYKATDSKYVMVGGETCDSTGLWSLCDSQGGSAIKDLNRMHYTYLNADYNNTEVNNYWTGVCLDEVKKRLGYRLHLTTATLSNSVPSGGSFNYTFNLTNTGFSSPINKRNVKLIFINTSSFEKWEAKLDVDPRYWFQGNHVLSGNVCLPTCMPSGNYELYLHFADPSTRLEDRPEYSIRLANNDTWDSAKGYNKLNHVVMVTSTSSNCSGTQMVKSINKWIGPNNGMWNSAIAHWSQGRFPWACDEVIIPHDKKVIVPAGVNATVKKITIYSGGELKVNLGAQVLVDE